MATKEQIFAPKYGKGIEDFKELIGSEYTIERAPANRKKFILRKVADNTEAYFKFKGPIGKMYNEYESLGREKFLEAYGIASIGPRTKKDSAEIQQKKAEKRAYRQEKRAEREKQKQNKEEIEKLVIEKQDIVVKLMNFDLVKGSPEHISLRERLDEYRVKLKELGYETVTDRMHNYTTSDLAEYQAEGEKKKRERRKKRRERLAGDR